MRSQVALSKQDGPIDFMACKRAHTCKGGVFKKHNKTRHLELLRATGQLVKTSFFLDRRKKSV
jgi:hypothetical protein